MIINVFIERASVIDKNLYCNALFKHSSRCRKLRMPYGLFLMARSIILGVRLREERWLKVICPVAKLSMSYSNGRLCFPLNHCSTTTSWLSTISKLRESTNRSEEHTSELQSH